MSGANYDGLYLHRIMLRDKVRGEAYAKALSRTVKPGHVVLDVGAGTGFLSMLAAKAGAKKVYGVERTGTADFAVEMVRRNGLESKVQILKQDIQEVKLPEKVDVIVSEWMGGYGIDENMLQLVLLARDRWLKPGGKVLPEVVHAWLAPVWDAELHEDMLYWSKSPFGLNFELINEELAQELAYGQHDIGPGELMAEPELLWTTDCSDMPLSVSQQPFKASPKFKILRDGRISALAAWFSADFGNGVTLSNAPDAPHTHWGRTVFPLNRTLPVHKGMPLLVEFTCEPAGVGFCRGGWSAKAGDAEWEHHEDHRNRK